MIEPDNLQSLIDSGRIIGTSLENDKRSAIQGSISEISPALHCDMYAVSIEDKTVWVIDTPSGKDKPYIFSGSIFVHEGANSQKLRTVEEMRSFFQGCIRYSSYAGSHERSKST